MGPTPAVGEPGRCPLACNGSSAGCLGTPPDNATEGNAEFEKGSVKNAAVGLCTPISPVFPRILFPLICEPSEPSSRQGGCLYWCWFWAAGRAIMPSISSRFVSRGNSVIGSGCVRTRGVLRDFFWVVGAVGDGGRPVDGEMEGPARCIVDCDQEPYPSKISL